MRRLLLVTAAAVLAAGAPAFAAPARTGEINDVDHLSYGWDFAGPGIGLMGDATVADHAPCTAVAQTCDFTLIHVGGQTPGDLAVTTSTSDKTLVDLDTYIYASDKDGTQGDQLALANGFTPNETASTSVDPGRYYLVKVAYMTGVGAYSGKAEFTPFVPDPEDGE